MQNFVMKGGTALLDVDLVLQKLELKAGFVVADLGCGGSGHFIAPIARIVGLGGKVYALDVQKGVLAATESKMKMFGLTNIEYIWSDLERVGSASIPEGSCDAALLANVLFQNDDRSSILCEARRCLRGGGRLLVVEWKPVDSPLGPPQEHRLTKEQVKDGAFEQGLHWIDEFEVGPYHYGLLFRNDQDVSV